MAKQLNCPCGVMIIAREDTFLDDVRAHLAAAHPGREYSDNEINLIAQPVPDRIVDELD